MRSPLLLDLDGDALTANWRALADRAGAAACGAAVKADGYGLGAAEVVTRLAKAGCRDFFVATWAEAARLGRMPDGAALSVLHGVRADDMGAARAGLARPVLNSPDQVRRWRDAGGGPCDVMVDTGMNRLGLSPGDAVGGLLDGLAIETLMSHFACADEPDHPMNATQARRFADVAARVPAARRSLANSAGILLGGHAHDLVRPGLALYGGHPAERGGAFIRPVARLLAEVLQVRDVAAGESVGYGATWIAPAASRVAVLNLGYADGFLRALGPHAGAEVAGVRCPVVGRVSMDLTVVDVTGIDVGEGARLPIPLDLPRLSTASGLSQYELLTGLGGRFDRRWR